MKPGTRYAITWAFGPTAVYRGIFRQLHSVLPTQDTSRHWWQFEDGLIVNPAHVANVKALED